MSRTVTALYDSRSEAESAKQRLSSTVDVERVQIIDQSQSGSSSSGSGSEGGWLSRLFLPDEDAHTYNEGIKRGGYLLCAQVDSDEDADRICNALEQTSPVNLDEREQAWRSEGWQGYQGDSARAGLSASAIGGSGYSQDRTETSGRAVEEERIPIVEEQMHVGKRQVERGGAHVRSYIREVPVHEQVHLREEHVEVERRPVNERISETELNRSGLLQDRDIDVRATGEEAVVGKEARVTEEVVVRKTAEERVEQIDDTVRHTEVDVDRHGNREGSAFGFDDDRNRQTGTQSTSEFDRTRTDR